MLYMVDNTQDEHTDMIEWISLTCSQSLGWNEKADHGTHLIVQLFCLMVVIGPKSLSMLAIE